MNKAPCKNCVDRHTLCWSTCQKYNDWQEEVRKARAEMYKPTQVSRCAQTGHTSILLRNSSTKRY